VWPVSVIIPAYNRELVIEAAVASAADQQPRSPAEILVIDDASTDNTASAALRQAVRLLRLPQNQGPGTARDLGIGAATQPWCAFLDSDDEWASDHLATLMSAVDQTVGFVASTAVTMIGNRLRVKGNPYRDRHRLDGPEDAFCPENVITTSACMVRTEVLRRVGGFGPGRHAEDLDLWVRALGEVPGVLLPQITVRYAITGVRASDDGRRMREAANSVVAAHGEQLGRQVLVGLRAVGYWDEFRSRLAVGQRTAALGSLSRLASPRMSPALLQLLLRRRQCRTRWKDQRERVEKLFAL
jgi:hypothetical protein